LPTFKEDVLQHFRQRYGNLHLPTYRSSIANLEKEGLLFKFIAETKLKKGTILKTMWQNNVIFCTGV
jgi:hypothetical protein